uniref:Glycoside hydrolase family 5 domain-containing protein n=1 Tax=Globisporangium ultimum (strain ATCC 200006 / CBS 805.95 / DAOM BR144) TaxID=431595 RepID=K3X2K4_GLOUD
MGKTMEIDEGFMSPTASPGNVHGVGSSYRYSYMNVNDTNEASRSSHSNRSSVRNSESVTRGSSVGGDVFIRGSLLDRHIEAVALEQGTMEKPKDYRGRIRTWPGLMAIVLTLGLAGFLMTYYAIKTSNERDIRQKAYQKILFDKKTIKGGTGDAVIGDDIISDDGVIGNPKKYPPSACELPNYLSKNGHIVAVSENGTEVPLKIKGINWFGMETGQAIPFGLWDNSENGTTAYQIATFLAQNKFNAVRLPLMATWILTNHEPNSAIINKQENRAISVKNYMSLLQSILKVLRFRNIGVLLSMHTLTYNDNGKLWYNDDVSEDDFLKAIDILTSNLCTQDFDYYDWYGGGLHGAKTKGLEFSVKDKVVWAPHYYTPAVFPQYYLYGGGTTVGSAIKNYVELDDDALRHRIKVTMDDMFGFLASETGPALLLGEFGGLYAEDKHPMKTTKRCTDFTMEIIKQPGWAGGFVWSLNPESEYQYNPADTPGRFHEGMVTLDWLNANTEFVKGMEAMDDMENLQPFPCFPTTASESLPSSGSENS